MTRNLPRRLQQLEIRFSEQRLARRLDDQGRSPAELIRERRLRYHAAEGRELKPLPPNFFSDLGDSPQNIGEVIRRRRLQLRMIALATAEGCA